MTGAVTIALIVVAALFVLWVISVCVYLVGAKMKARKDAHEHVEDRTSIWGWGVVYSAAGLTVLALLVRFVKFIWTLD